MSVDRRRAAMLAAAAAAVALGCSGDPVGTDSGASGPSIRVVAGAGVVDTVLAQPVQALVVEVRGRDGAPARGVVVQFEPVLPTDSTRREERAVNACALAVPTCGPVGDQPYGGAGLLAIDTTDAAGRAQALIRLGTVAGSAAVVMSAPDLGVRDTARYTVRPGAARHVTYGATEPVVQVGRQLPLHPTVRDRFGNVRGDAVTLAADAGGVVELDGSGVLTGRRVGQGRILACAAGVVDTAVATVVPRGRLVAVEYDLNGGGWIVLVDLDGSNLRRLEDIEGMSDAFPTWSPDGRDVAFQVLAGNPHVVIVDTTGANRRTIPSEGEPRTALFPQFSADGRSVLFQGYSPTTDFGLWRASRDGTGAVQLRSGVGSDPYNSPGFSVDRDVTRLAVSLGNTIWLADAQAETEPQYFGIGRSPVWSPRGDRLAYVGFGFMLTVVDRDGDVDSARALREDIGLEGGLTWSPDGEWVLGHPVDGGLLLARPSDGFTMRFRLPIELREPYWR
jgi:hypothetical protein